MSQTPTDELFDALRKGDERAMERFLPLLRERISHVAKQRLRKAQVEDVVQDTLATLWEKRDSIAEADHLLPFLFRVLRNKIGNAYMRSRRERGREGDRGGLDSLLADAAAHNPGALFEAKELEQGIDQAMRQCARENAMQGRVLQYLDEGRSASEISAALGGMPISTVRTHIHRGRKRLKRILKRHLQLDL